MPSRPSDPTSLIVAAAVLVVAVLAGGLAAVASHEPLDPPHPVAVAYLEAWQAGDLAPVADALTVPVDTVAAVHRQQDDALAVTRRTLTLGRLVVRADSALAPYRAELDLAGLGTWSYDGALRLVRRDGDWLIEWSLATVHPSLTADRAFARTRSWPERAPVLAADGAALSEAGLAVHVAGRVGELSAERVAELGPPYLPGDRGGLYGLQASQERQLAGSPGGEVQLVDPAGAVVEVLHRVPAVLPSPVRTTIEPGVQRAAEAALAGGGAPAGLVAVDGRTGAVRAVANRPVSGFNRATAGRYPPGSTFKVVTALALLRAGVTPESTVECPPTVNVGGRRFRNFEGEAFGPIPFREAFSHSCNTAFIGEAVEVGVDGLMAAARDLGFGVAYDVGLPLVEGRFPEPASEVELAAAAIGQARVEASPLHMASVAAAVASGRWWPPHLVAGAGPDPTLADAPVGPLDPGHAATLRDLMRGVVQGGTGTRAAVAGVDIGGKTGTAEYGAGSPPPTHAWFVGFHGDLGFAVVVDGGGVGGQVAAPLAARFVAALTGAGG